MRSSSKCWAAAAKKKSSSSLKELKMSERLTVRQAAVIGAYTGILAGKFADMPEYIEVILGRPVFTHELASEEVFQEIKETSRQDFQSIVCLDNEA